jgi:HK97 gp10 family phage protein
MADLTIRVDGLQELSARLRTLAADVENKFAGRATGKAAQIVKKAAKAQLRASPSIESGLLEKNVIVKKLGKTQSQGLTSQHIVTVKKVIYPRRGKESHLRNTKQIASYKEFGTVHVPPEPFIRPALERNIQPGIDAMADSLKSDLFKAGA